MSLEHLSLTTRTRLRSTQILTSLSQIISELLQNSLDAGAHQIDIGVNCEEWTCWVTDDGHGISRDDLSQIGTHGRYGTSKAYSSDSLNLLSTFGFRGEALASAADLGCLEISSRTSRARETWSTILKEGKTLYSGTAVRWKRTSHGTTVCVRDAFYNVPVRRLSHPSPSKTFEIIKRELESYALVFPDVSMTFRFANGNQSKENVITIPKSPSKLAVFRRLYGRALCEHVEEIDISSEDMRVEGFISLDGALSKSYQFFYINRHPVDQGDLQRIIESRFNSSTFTKHAFEDSGETFLRPSIRRSPRKTEKKPVYVLNMSIPMDKVDNLLEPAKGVVHLRERDAVYSFLSSTIDGFLLRHGFSSQPLRRGKDDTSPLPRKRRRLDKADDSGYAEDIDICEEEGRETYDLYEKNNTLYIGEDNIEDDSGDDLVWTDASTGQTFVVDKRTGNSRLRENLLNDTADKSTEALIRPERRTLLLQSGTAPTFGRSEVPEWIRKALGANETYRLGEERIISTNNISSRNGDGDNSGSYSHGRCQAGQRPKTGLLASETTQHRFNRADVHDATVVNQVDRKFVACVFDNCVGEKMKEGPNKKVKNGRTLVLIDQHAADERIRVELFLKELCLGFLQNQSDPSRESSQNNAIVLRHVIPPCPILLTWMEERQLKSSQEIQKAFRSWGVYFSESPQIAELVDHGERMNDADGDNNDSYAQIAVQSIPEVVADKLLLGDELRDLVKGFLSQIEEGAIDISGSRLRGGITGAANDSLETQENVKDWIKALRWCPRQLLDLVNSKACRGAIMFNDSLTNEQCERLVRQLADTAFPFQCAHGRPSLVPLANFGKLRPDRGKSRRPPVKWSVLEEETHPD